MRDQFAQTPRSSARARLIQHGLFENFRRLMGRPGGERRLEALMGATCYGWVGRRGEDLR
jgi:hypothetical protein